MNASETYSCLRDLQVVPTVPRITDVQISELVKRKLILRVEKTGHIVLTQLGVFTKNGQC